MKACIIFNPTARGERARHLRAYLDTIGGQCALRPTPGPGTAQDLAARAVEEGFDTVVAAGGDGTVNEVLNGLARTATGLAKARLGILPLGTVNVFAKELGLPLEVEAAWRTVREGVETQVDLPEVTFNRAGAPARVVFAQLAGAGLDSRAIARLNWGLKKRIGPLAYVAAGLQAMAGRQPRVTAVADGPEATGELILIGNGRYYGGRFELFPGASLRDGLLTIRVFPRADLGTLVRFGWEWLASQTPKLGSVGCFQAAAVTLRCAERVPFEVDGDNVGDLPATFRVQPRALRVLVPPAQGR